MAKRSKGRVKKFEDNVIQFRSRDELYGEERHYTDDDFFEPFDVDEFLSEDREEYFQKNEEEEAPVSDGRKRKQTAKDKRKKKRMSKSRRKRLLIYAVALVLVVSLVGGTVTNIVHLKSQERALLQEQEDLQAEKERLQDEIQRVDDPEYIEQKAREMLHLIMPGETLYRFPDEEE